jgi:hypothetical protein
MRWRPRRRSWRQQELWWCWRIVARPPFRYNRMMLYQTLHDFCITCSIVNRTRMLTQTVVQVHCFIAFFCYCSSGNYPRPFQAT